MAVVAFSLGHADQRTAPGSASELAEGFEASGDREWSNRAAPNRRRRSTCRFVVGGGRGLGAVRRGRPFGQQVVDAQAQHGSLAWNNAGRPSGGTA
jgi:hypothetical protein